MNHEYCFEVRGYELDGFNHVNNAVYLNYLEEARWKFLQETGWINYTVKESLYAVVTETNIRYINELRVFDEAVVKSKWSHEGEFLICKQNIYLKETNKKIAKAVVKMILVSSDRVCYEIPQFMKEELANGNSRK